ncbi:Ran GTPase-binding protein [Maudiozyma humilis]|uniref:Ran GTPase-binding protein n=1 Tax=Maudiozyma humilis TaxID=51915 RepID=A0AAV5SC77_MAUHU|nr:Ran GTPase-binding protein [Kazachstania humilis]
MASTTPLYGGAITTVIPGGFLDASLVREVPDTQEVYVNSRQAGEESTFGDGLGLNESVIVDLLQQVDARDDRAALDVHIEEIASLNQADSLHVQQHETLGPHTQVCVCVEDALKWGKRSEKETVVVCTGLLRLPDVQTDVVCSVNVPVTAEQPEELAQLQRGELPARVLAAFALVKRMVTEFTVVDKSLFA